MIRALKGQFKYLVREKDKKFHQILRDHIGKKATPILEDKLKRFIILMPDMLSRIYYFRNHKASSPNTKELCGYLLMYLYHPNENSAIDRYSLFGYMDDAYFIFKVYTQVINVMRDQGKRITILDKNLYEEVTALKRSVISVIPMKTAKIDAAIENLASFRSLM